MLLYMFLDSSQWAWQSSYDQIVPRLSTIQLYNFDLPIMNFPLLCCFILPSYPSVDSTSMSRIMSELEFHLQITAHFEAIKRTYRTLWNRGYGYALVLELHSEQRDWTKRTSAPTCCTWLLLNRALQLDDGCQRQIVTKQRIIAWVILWLWQPETSCYRPARLQGILLVQLSSFELILVSVVVNVLDQAHGKEPSAAASIFIFTSLSAFNLLFHVA